MRVLMIGHSWVVPTYQKMLGHLAEMPNVELTAVVPNYWVEGSHRVYAKHHQDSRFDIRIVRPLTHRQHLHLYPTMPLILARSRPDIVFLLEEPNSLVTATTLLLANKRMPRTKRAFYTFLNDDRDFTKMRGIRRIVYPWAMRVSFRLAEGAACASEGSAQQMQQRGYRNDIQVIPFGLDTEAYLPDTSQALHLRKRMADTSDFLVGFVGRLVPGKGVDLILRAISMLPPAHQRVRLVVIGDGEERERLEQLALDLGMSDNVGFIGAVPHGSIRNWLGAFDVLIVPSRRQGHWTEQFGRTIVEAMAARVPVIGSDSGEVPHVIGGHGLVFREDDPVDLRDKLSEVRNWTPNKRDQVTEGAYQYVTRKFDFRCVAKQYYEWFMELVG